MYVFMYEYMCRWERDTHERKPGRRRRKKRKKENMNKKK